jgi:hypothetical protein
MSGEEIQFVNQISAMGFPVGRVARAVKNLGCKEREVGAHDRLMVVRVRV